MQCPPELAWLLRATFAPAAPPEPDGLSQELIAAYAIGFDLAPRFVMQRSRHAVQGYLGQSARSVIAPTYMALASQQRMLSGIPALGYAADEIGIPIAFLKSAALHLGGHTRLGWRNAGDVDVLVPEASARRYWSALQERGWRALEAEGAELDHALPLLGHPVFGRVEVHWATLGIDAGGRRLTTTFADLARARLLLELSGYPGRVMVPCSSFLAAHAVVHGLGQHGFVIDYPFFRIVSDLLDLGVAAGASLRDLCSPWLAGTISAEEIDALQTLTVHLAGGDSSLFDGLSASNEPESILLRHFLVAGLEPAYRDLLRFRLAFSVLSHEHRHRTLFLRAVRSLFPEPGHLASLYGTPRSAVTAGLQRLIHPFVQLGRALQLLVIHSRSLATGSQPSPARASAHRRP